MVMGLCKQKLLWVKTPISSNSTCKFYNPQHETKAIADALSYEVEVMVSEKRVGCLKANCVYYKIINPHRVVLCEDQEKKHWPAHGYGDILSTSCLANNFLLKLIISLLFHY